MRKNNDTLTKTTGQIIRENLCTVFNLLNFLIALSLALVKAWSNLLFLSIILVNTLIGIVQELKAKRLVERLSLLSAPTAAVLRDGRREQVTPEQIQKGDILLLESGSVVCGDSVVLSGSVEVSESILTGESEPVLKRQGDALLSGSWVICGKCQGKVIHSSKDNYTARLESQAKRHRATHSELLLSIRRVTKFTSYLILPLGILLFLEAYFLRGNSMAQSVIASSAGLLGMLPKGLVLLISVSLSVGVIYLSKRNVLVQDLYSLENLARCDVLCLDKTGTLTQGQMRVESLVLLDGGDEALVSKLIGTYLAHTEDNNATYRALKDYFKGAGSFPATGGVAFSSERKWSSVTLEDGRILLLGALERLCPGAPLPGPLQVHLQQGKRAIFLALADRLPTAALAPEVTLLAAVILSDPMRKNVQSTISYFEQQGVSVKVLSGDSPLTASAVAKRAGIQDADRWVDLSQPGGSPLEELAENNAVFARVSPEQKKQLIAALQKNGHTVAMTGDGVNDLLAMRQADCSIAMGQGSDAARQTAQLVLLDSDFSVLKEVIAQGRRVVNNITKSAGVFFIKTIYSFLISTLCVLLNAPFPFIPIQITVIDALIEGLPAFAFSFEKNQQKISGRFLDTALRAACPKSVAITLCYLLLFVAAPNWGVDPAQMPLFLYLIVGVVSLMGVVEASRPFRWRKAFCTLVSAGGFFAAILLFSPILELPAFAYHQRWLFLSALSLSVLLAGVPSLLPRRFAFWEKRGAHSLVSHLQPGKNRPET